MAGKGRLSPQSIERLRRGTRQKTQPVETIDAAEAAVNAPENDLCPFAAVEYVPSAARAFWLGEDTTLHVPGISIVAGQQSGKEQSTPPDGPDDYDESLTFTVGESGLSRHRENLFTHYRAGCLEGFKNQQALEFLLQFALPGRNTEPLAEMLLDRFGSLYGVLGAGLERLETVKGMTPEAAVLLDMVMRLARRAVDEQNGGSDLLDTDEKVGQFFVNKFYGLTNETIFLLCLDNSCRLISCTELASGSSSITRINVRLICETLLSCNAPIAILAHNHPGGRAYPSNEDIRTTARLQGLLKLMDIDLVDHFIISGNHWKSMASLGEMSITKITQI